MHDLNDLFYFVKVVDYGGFAPAGRALGEQKSKLSRRIGLLEGRLGVRLIQRSTRQFSVTEIGQEFYRHCAAMIVEAEAAEAVIEEVRAEPSGVVRLSCPTALLNYQVGELIAQFMQEYPKVEIHLTSTNRPVDVIGEGFDLAIRVRKPPLEETELVMRKLDKSTQSLVASPKFLEARGAISLPSQLHDLPSLSVGPAHREFEWRLTGEDGAEVRIPHTPRLVTDDMMALRKAAVEGLGVVELPTIVAWKDVKDGRLQYILPEWVLPVWLVHVVFPSRRGLLPSVRALIDFLVNACARHREEADLTWRMATAE